MDILISSNLERLLYYESDGDCDLVQRLMDNLSATGRYEVPAALLARIQKTFLYGFASDEEARASIRRVFDAHSYLMDPHTAVAWHVSQNAEKSAEAKRVVLSTASPYKFCRDVCEALEIEVDGNDFAAMRALEAAQAHAGASPYAAPAALASLEHA